MLTTQHSEKSWCARCLRRWSRIPVLRQQAKHLLPPQSSNRRAASLMQCKLCPSSRPRLLHLVSVTSCHDSCQSAMLSSWCLSPIRTHKHSPSTACLTLTLTERCLGREGLFLLSLSGMCDKASPCPDCAGRGSAWDELQTEAKAVAAQQRTAELTEWLGCAKIALQVWPSPLAGIMPVSFLLRNATAFGMSPCSS